MKRETVLISLFDFRPGSFGARELKIWLQATKEKKEQIQAKSVELVLLCERPSPNLSQEEARRRLKLNSKLRDALLFDSLDSHVTAVHLLSVGPSTYRFLIGKMKKARAAFYPYLGLKAIWRSQFESAYLTYTVARGPVRSLWQWAKLAFHRSKELPNFLFSLFEKPFKVVNLHFPDLGQPYEWPLFFDQLRAIQGANLRAGRIEMNCDVHSSGQLEMAMVLMDWCVSHLDLTLRPNNPHAARVPFQEQAAKDWTDFSSDQSSTKKCAFFVPAAVRAASNQKAKWLCPNDFLTITNSADWARAQLKKGRSPHTLVFIDQEDIQCQRDPDLDLVKASTRGLNFEQSIAMIEFCDEVITDHPLYIGLAHAFGRETRRPDST